jgi:DNA repair exonuclease SbcCD ATPase subunit
MSRRGKKDRDGLSINSGLSDENMEKNEKILLQSQKLKKVKNALREQMTLNGELQSENERLQGKVHQMEVSGGSHTIKTENSNMGSRLRHGNDHR